MEIQITNNKCKILGDIKVIHKLHKEFNIKNPNAHFIRVRGNVDSTWDGKIKYITEANYFKTGLLPQIYDYLINTLKVKVKLTDYREEYLTKCRIPKYIGENELRGYQKEAIEAIINNKVGDLDFPFGAINAATNAGKTTIMAGIHEAYRRKIPSVILLNDGDLYDQFKRELPLLLRDEDIGFIRGKKDNKWGNITVCMVQTVSQNIKLFSRQLAKKGIVLVDEADLADNKTYKTVLNACPNAKVRVALSGTLFLSKLKKDFPKNQNIRSYFGNEVYKITKSEMVGLGHSTEVVVSMYRGSTKPGNKGNFKAEYDRGIMYNEDRAMVCVGRLKHNIKVGRLPALIVCQFHDHIDLMYKVFNKELGKKYRVEAVHHKTKNRAKLFEEFRLGKIDILISSFIVKRGKNMPLTRYLLNAAGSDSQETIWQIMGRLERKDKTKKRAYMEDLYDEGHYLERHSKHRMRYYKESGMRVKVKY